MLSAIQACSPSSGRRFRRLLVVYAAVLDAGCYQSVHAFDRQWPWRGRGYTTDRLVRVKLRVIERRHVGCSGLVVEYRTHNREVAGSTHTRSTASNLEQVANLLCAQANSASYPQWDWK